MKSVKIFNRNILIDLILVIDLVVVFVIILRYIFPKINQYKNYILYLKKTSLFRFSYDK